MFVFFECEFLILRVICGIYVVENKCQEVFKTETIRINEAVLSEFEVKDVISMHQHWRNGQVFNTLLHPKTNHAFLYFQNGSAKYTDSKGNTFYVQNGDVVFIPFGAIYKTEFFCETGETDTVLINFNLYLNDVPFTFDDKIAVFLSDADLRVDELFEKTAKEYSKPKHSYSLLKSYIFRVIHEIAERQNNDYLRKTRFSVIGKGILYLENDAKQELSIKEIAEMCNVSENYFRTLFRQYAGMSPTKYRTSRQIETAKKLLDTGYNVSETAEQLGFSDVAYFSRVFKNETSLTPSNYIKLTV